MIAIGAQWSGTIVCKMPTPMTAPTSRTCGATVTIAMLLTATRAFPAGLSVWADLASRHSWSPATARATRLPLDSATQRDSNMNAGESAMRFQPDWRPRSSLAGPRADRVPSRFSSFTGLVSTGLFREDPVLRIRLERPSDSPPEKRSDKTVNAPGHDRELRQFRDGESHRDGSIARTNRPPAEPSTLFLLLALQPLGSLIGFRTARERARAETGKPCPRLLMLVELRSDKGTRLQPAPLFAHLCRAVRAGTQARTLPKAGQVKNSTLDRTSSVLFAI